MLVNRGRLDLESLTPDRVCMIVTGSTSITLTHGTRSMQMGLYLKGVGPMDNFDTFTSVERGRNGEAITYWFHLDRLSPNRLYQLTVDVHGRESFPGMKLSDKTPDKQHEYDRYRPGNRTLIDRLLGRKR